jgi:hypothetical protein
MAAWGYKYLPFTEELGIRAWAELMDELREIHLGLKPKRRAGPSAGERLQAAYEKVVEEGQRLTSARRNPRAPDERRGTSSLTHT